MKKLIPFFVSLFILIAPICTSAKKNIANTTGHLYFIENKGQIKDQYGLPRKDIQFVLQGQGVSVFIGNGQLHYQFSHRDVCAGNHVPTSKDLSDKNADAAAKSYADNIQPSDFETYQMDVELTGANLHSEIITEEQQGYYENYYIHGCPANGIQAHTYRKITYKNILPNIDWVISVKGEKLEHEFVIKPGGNASDIKFKYNGQTSLKIDQVDGSIVATTPMGTIREKAPLCYLPDGVKISSSFKLKGNELRYDINEYNGTLVIDPILEWGTYYGMDSNITYFYDMVADDSAHIYGCGITYSTNIGTIATTGCFQYTYAGNADAYIVKFDSSGNRLWGTYYGGSQGDWATAITYDNLGNIYVGGSTNSDSDIATPGTWETSFIPCQWAGFMVKFNSAGARDWGTYVGGTLGPSFDLEITSINCDIYGHVYVSGACDDTAHISTPGCWKYIKTDPVNVYDCFLQQYDTSGMLIWGTYYGGSGNDLRGAACINGIYLYLTGWTVCDTGIASAGGYQPAIYNVTNSDAFIAKFDSAGNRVWGTYYGGEGQEIVGGIICTESAVYLLGCTNSDTNMASTGCFQPLRSGGFDAFLAEFAGNTSDRIWSTYYGGPADERTDLSRITFDDSENVYIVGYTSSTTGIATPCTWQTTYGGGDDDAFLAKYSSSGTQIWATYYGGNYDDEPRACAWDGKNIYICGRTNSLDDIATTGSFLPTGGGDTDYYQGFLAKFRDVVYPGPILGATTICRDSISTLSDIVGGGTWSSSNTAVATIVSTTGHISAVSTGTTTITYSLAGCATTFTTVTVHSCPNGIPAIGNTHSVEIYPNPATNQLTIESDIANYNSLIITNEVGQVLIKQKISGMRTSVDIKQLIPANYYIILKGDDGTFVEKFTKE